VSEFDPVAHMHATAAMLGIALDESWKPGITDNLLRSYQIAQAFLGHLLEDDVEPASRFEP
jgi:hypothetical protein